MQSHFEEAVDCLNADNIGGSFIDPDTRNLQRAQIEATLALAEAQQTANLIAYLTAYKRGELAYEVPNGVLTSIQSDLEVRLGLV